MVEQKLQVVRLKDDFYRDGFYKVAFTLLVILSAISLLVTASLFIFFSKPSPIQFVTVDDEWRIVQPIRIESPYLASTDVLQWVSDALPSMFAYDFLNYDKRLKETQHYFTENGWNTFLDVINTYVSQDSVQDSKLFVNATPTGAPVILNQGILEKRYAWWVQMPLTLTYVSINGSRSEEIKIQALVVRVPLLNNLDGISIDNIIVSKK
jgi:intracellular multiplication protein IcmL